VTEKEEKIFKIANNVLCYDDNSDFGTALWKILEVVKPEMFEESDEPELKLIT
jgi:hypothetical protein